MEAFQELVGALFSPSALVVTLKGSCPLLPGESGTYTWVGLSWQDSHSHNRVLVCHYECFISSCWATRWGLAEEG